MRKSSRGNPWHDSRGRFCSGPQNGGVMSSHEITKVELSPGDSMKLTTQTSENPLFERNPKELKNRHYDQTLSVTDDSVILETETTLYGKKTKRTEEFNMSYKEFSEYVELTNKQYDAEGDVSWEYDGDNIWIYDNADSYFAGWNGDGSSTTILTANGDGFDYVVRDEYEDIVDKGRIERNGDKISVKPKRGRKIDLNDNDEMKRYFRIIELRDKDPSMPWETDPKYRNNKNGQLLWLMDHPESKYANPEFTGGLKRIESMSDMGVSAEKRKAAFSNLCKSCGMTEAEGRHFISEEFLK